MNNIGNNTSGVANVSHITWYSFLLLHNLQADSKCAQEKFKKYLNERPHPFIKWAGGKRQLLTQFKDLNLYPPEDFKPKENVYFEPFVGGAAVFLDLLPQNAILADVNEELVIAYNVIKNNVEALISKLKVHQKNNSKEYFLKVRAQNWRKMSDVSVAARFIYLNKTCFNGLYRVNSKGQFNVPYGRYKNPKIVDEENLIKLSKVLNERNVQILHQDFKDTVKDAKKGDFIYFDPPYAPLSQTSSFTSYTKDGFSAQDQIELRDLFWELHKRGCFVMLSNSNSDFISEIYGELTRKDNKIKIHKINAHRMINSNTKKRGKIKELLIVNY